MMRHALSLSASLAFLWALGCQGAVLRSTPAFSLSAQPARNVPLVRLSWDPHFPGANGFLIERSQDGKTFSQVARVAPDVGFYHDPSAKPNTLYVYRVCPTGLPDAPAATSFVKTTAFRVFDCTYFRDKPDLAPFGIEPLYITGNQFFWQPEKPGGGYDMNTPNERATRNVARRVAQAGQILVINIEHWPIDIRKAPQADVNATIQKLSRIIDWIRDEQPEVKLGIYAIGPLRDYWTPVQYWTAIHKPNDPWYRGHLSEFADKHRQWQKANDFLKPLVDKCDYTFPSLYTFYNNPDNWVLYAKGNIQEANRYGKPVLPFIWMDYHDSTDLVGQRIPAEFWRLQLQTIRQMADGIVIWGGVKAARNAKPQNEPWDETDPWWLETKAFLLELDAS